MLQVSNAVVSAYFIVLVFRTNCCIWTVWICTTNIVYWLFFFYFLSHTGPRQCYICNGCHDWTGLWGTGKYDESASSYVLSSFIRISFSIYCCKPQRWFILIFVLFTFLGKGIQRESRCCISYCYQVRWPCKRWWCIECVSITSLSFWKLRSYLHFLSWVKGFFFQSATKFFPLLPITPCNELNAIWPMDENQA